MATITCHDCGESRARVPANTLYCKKCRLLRDVQYWRTATRNCMECRAVFAPLNRSDRHCSSCNPGLLHHRGPCGVYNPKAGEEPHIGLRALGAIPICADCIRDPKKRRRLINGLANGQTDRRATNNWKES